MPAHSSLCVEQVLGLPAVYRNRTYNLAVTGGIETFLFVYPVPTFGGALLDFTGIDNYLQLARAIGADIAGLIAALYCTKQKLDVRSQSRTGIADKASYK
jgi:hypothetical protein